MSAYGMDIEREWECACLLQYSNMRALAANVASKMPLFVLRTHDMSVPRARLHVYLGAQAGRQTEEADDGCGRRDEGGGERRAVGGGRWAVEAEGAEGRGSMLLSRHHVASTVVPLDSACTCNRSNAGISYLIQPPGV